MAVFQMAPLPSTEDAWQQVLAFCRKCRDDETPIRTLEKGNANLIVHVDYDVIKRKSEASPAGQNTAHIRRTEFEKVWEHLDKHRWAQASPHVFLLAILCAALPELVKYVGGQTIVARERCELVAAVGGERQERERRGSAWPKYSYRDHGEGFQHWVLKYYIHDQPGVALIALPGGPWNECRRELEVQFPIPTQDRVDVVVFDSAGVPLMIEVKPNVEPGDIGYYAQAAKYRAIWQVLSGTSVRCVLAAPRIPSVLAAQMRELHGIESVEVDVPSDYRDRMRPIFDAQAAELGSR